MAQNKNGNNNASRGGDNCSFCGARRSEVEIMFQGANGASICNKCIENGYKIMLDNDIVPGRQRAAAAPLRMEELLKPAEIKAFYMRLNDDDKTVAATDLLVPGIGELCGASQREERYDVLLNRIRELGLNEEDYWWYLDLRRFGGNKHAGFGLGFERCVMYLTGMGNIRDVVPFPRTVNNCEL